MTRRAALRAAVAALAVLGAAAPASERTARAAPAGPAPAGGWVDPATLTFPEVRYVPPKPHKAALGNGATVYILEDHELPIVEITLHARGGALFDPAAKLGLSAAAAAVLRTGGAASMTGDALDEELEFLGASIESFGGPELQTVGAQCLVKDLPRVLSLLADLLKNPAFRQEKLDLWKGQQVEGIRRRFDAPGPTATIYIRKRIYGDESPYARLSTEETIAAITREDLLALHQRRFVTSNLTISAVGDFAEQEMIARIEETLRGLPRGKPDRTPPPKADVDAGPAVYHVERALPQTSLRLGHLGANRLTPDRFPLILMNYVLGTGGFSSRLMKEVRVEKGLAYSVGGAVGFGPDRGLFTVSSETKSGSTLAAIRSIRGIVEEMRETPPTDRELAEARNYEINSFAFYFPTTAAAVEQQVASLLEGLPEDYWARYVEKVRAVTRENVLRVARAYLDPERLVILTVGKRSDFDGDLASLGRVTEIVPPRPGRKAGPPTPAPAPPPP